MTNTPPPPPPSYAPDAPQGQPDFGHLQPPQGSGPYGHPHQPGWAPGYPQAPQPPEKKKSWFRRHKIMTALLVILALIIVGNLAGGGEDEGAADSAPAAAVEAPADAASAVVEAEPADADADAAAEADAEAAAAQEAAEAEAAAAEEAAQAEVEAAVPGLGDAVRDGQFEFTVGEVQTGLTTIGEGFTEETPQGQFVLINITVTNIGDSGTTMFDGAQVLIDEQGREHSTSSASMWLDEGLWLDEINPGNSMSGVLLYDIPVDAIPTSLELHDSMFSGGVTVSLK